LLPEFISANALHQLVKYYNPRHHRLLGSAQRMKYKIQFKAKNSRAKITSEEDCSYVQFSEDPIERTVEITKGYPALNLDIDKDGLIVGLELLGEKEFTLKKIIAAVTPVLPENERGSLQASLETVITA
jgi:uncharacterized protein YuzE